MSRAQTPAEPAGAPADGGSKPSSRASSRASQRSKLLDENEPIAINGSKPPSRPKSAVSQPSKPATPSIRDQENVASSPKPTDAEYSARDGNDEDVGGDDGAKVNTASPAPPSRPRSGLSRPGSGGKSPLGEQPAEQTAGSRPTSRQSTGSQRQQAQAQAQAQAEAEGEGEAGAGTGTGTAAEAKAASATASAAGSAAASAAGSAAGSKRGSAASIRIPRASADQGDQGNRGDYGEQTGQDDDVEASARAASAADAEAADAAENNDKSRPSSSKPQQRGSRGGSGAGSVRGGREGEGEGGNDGDSERARGPSRPKSSKRASASGSQVASRIGSGAGAAKQGAQAQASSEEDTMLTQGGAPAGPEPTAMSYATQVADGGQGHGIGRVAEVETPYDSAEYGGGAAGAYASYNAYGGSGPGGDGDGGDDDGDNNGNGNDNDNDNGRGQGARDGGARFGWGGNNRDRDRDRNGHPDDGGDDGDDGQGDDNGDGDGDGDGDGQAETEADGELLVLDPDHPLMQRFQTRLNEHLSKHLDRKTQQLRELLEAAKRKRREREDVGVELLGVQQELARQQMQLEQKQESLAAAKKTRCDTDWRLTDVRSRYRDVQQKVNDELRQTAELQTEVENLALKVHFLRNAQRDVGGDVTLMKRVAEKAQRDKQKAEQDKQEQDVIVDRLVEQIDRRREQMGLYEAQLVAQAEETRAAMQAASEARSEIESIEVEKKQLYQHWNASLVGMRRRDEAYAAMQEALNQQRQSLQSLEMEIDGFKRSISGEQEQNEKLMLILKKTEQDAATSKKMLQQSEQRYDQLKQEYSTRARMLHETEQQLQRVQAEKNVKQQELTALRKQVEREYEEKVRLEDEILERIRSRLTLVKASQYTDKLTGKIRDRTKQLESQLVEAENEIARDVLETANVKSGVEKLDQIIRGLLGEIEKKNQLIARSDAEMSKRVIAIERKQDQVDQLQKKLQTMITSAGGEELGPLEVQINLLSKTIQTTLEQIGELQQIWLRDQQELVHLTRQGEQEAHDFDISKKEHVILMKKRLRVENRIDVERAEIRQVVKSIGHLRNEMEKLNALLFKERGQKQVLEQDNSLVETDFVLRLKELEKESLVLSEQVDVIKQEKEKFIGELIEAERQIMEWEKKTQLAIETKKAVDTEIGAGEISAMKNEIHRMEVRFTQLKRQQELLIQEMEKSVSRRDTIFTRGEAMQQSKHKSVTKGQIERKLADMRRQVKVTLQEANRVEQQTEGLKGEQQNLIEQLEEKRANAKGLQRSIDQLDAELSQLQEQREKMMLEVLALQRKAKNLQQLKDGKYVRVCRNAGALENELQKQIERLHGLCLAIDRLNQEQPQFQGQLRMVSVLLNARAAWADAENSENSEN